jgi:tetratricopeptide (TPR) repeat protein
MLKRVALLLLLISTPANAADGRYDRCMALAARQPQAAYDMAGVWRSDGGGAAAMHCQAMSLINLGQPARAAGVLEAAAAKLEPSPVIAADMYAQAGNAWLLAGDARRASARFTSALDRLPVATPARADILIDRARAFAVLEDKTKTLADLTAALTLAPKNTDARLLRAETYLSLGDKPKAKADLSAAKLLPMEASEKAVWEKLTAKAAK